jgi:glycosyltransferase involved in cell wall biosynthesis
MRIVVATLYEAVGGSSKVLLAAAEALRAEHKVIVRAPLPSADSRIPRPLSELVLDSWPRKLAALPALMRILRCEWTFAGQSQPDVFYVHDAPSLYVYGLIGRLRGMRVVWHVHMQEGEGMRRVLRNALCDAKLFVSRALVSSPQTKPWTVAANPIAVGPVTRRAGSGARVLGILSSISRLKNQELGLRVLAELRRRAGSARLVIFGNVLEANYRERLTELTSSLELGGGGGVSRLCPHRAGAGRDRRVTGLLRVRELRTCRGRGAGGWHTGGRDRHRGASRIFFRCSEPGAHDLCG